MPLSVALLVVTILLIVLSLYTFRGYMLDSLGTKHFGINSIVPLKKRRHNKMAAKAELPEELRVIEFSPERYCDQAQSPLFSILPGEVRDRIFAYALSSDEDTSALYDVSTCYRRPDYLAPRLTSTTILRTCQRIYSEAFFHPFTLAPQTLFLTAPDRRPARTTTIEALRRSLATVHALHGETELASTRVFAQLYMLQSGTNLSQILALPLFYPKSFTVTIRHTDCWHWEFDEPLHIAAQWVKSCRFPSSLRTLRVQLESLERKRAQVDYVTSLMAQFWRFRRTDGAVLTSSGKGLDAEIMRWRGSSTWGGNRWVRDETTNVPGTLEYYCKTVIFRPTGREEKEVGEEVWEQSWDIGGMPGVVPMQGGIACVGTREMQQVGAVEGMGKEELVELVGAWRAGEQQRQEEARRAQAARGAHLAMVAARHATRTGTGQGGN